MKMFKILVVLVIFALIASGCNPVDWFADMFGYQKVTEAEEVPIVVIDGYGSQGAFGDTINGRKIIVRDDLEPNENGWYEREVYAVDSLEDLGIPDEFKTEFPIEYERDYSSRNKKFVDYFSMNISPTIPIQDIHKFVEGNPSIVATSVVLRVDAASKNQECSLPSLEPDAVRFVLYAGQNINFQTCDPAWTTPQ